MLFYIRTEDVQLEAIVRILLESVARDDGLEVEIVSGKDFPRQARLLVADAALGKESLPGCTLFTGRGAGDLPFPFLREDFLAAVKCLLSQKAPPLEEGYIRLPEGEPLLLTQTEWMLFCLLFEAGTDGITSRALAEKLWHSEEKAASLPVYIHHLRRKLEADGKKRLLSLRGCGYRLMAGDITVGGGIC